MESADIIGKKYLRVQTLFTAVAFLVTGIILSSDPAACFADRRLGAILAWASIVYFAFFALFNRCFHDLHGFVRLLSLFGICVLGFIVHMTGGVVSPLTCFYFALLTSEVGYGVISDTTIFASAASYLIVVLGEASGLLEVHNPLAKTVYDSPLLFIFLTAAVVSYMIMTGYIGKFIVKALRANFAEEQRRNQALRARFAALETHSHIGMLAHRIVHDLRGPLATISGYIELQLQSPGQDADEKAALSDVMGMVNKMADSLGSISRYGRVSDGKKEKIDLKDFFKAIVSIMGYYPGASKVRFLQNYPPGPELCVMAYRQDLQQAYFNILKNSLEAVADNTGEKTVEISARVSGGAVEVDIANNGRPIPGEIIEKLFKQSVTGKADGTGVGMLITHDLLSNNDISINIMNMGGTGVKTTTRLPLCRDKEPG